MVIYGTTGSDVLVGGDGNDVISGIPATGTDLGRSTIDRLTGGQGSDLFILGDMRGAFYNKGMATSAGVNDYAVITDFGEGDRIQVAPGTYFLRDTRTKTDAGTGVFMDRNGNGVWDQYDELIAIVNGPEKVTLADLITATNETPVPPPSTPAPPPASAPGNAIFGTTGSDVIVGTSGNDVISGVPATGTHLGRSTIDRLTGGGGNDLFVLGDARGAFYNKGMATSAGVNDYAVITDFSSGDRVQLAQGTYFLVETRTKLDEGTGIFMDRNGNGVWDSHDELIGIVQGPHKISFADIVFG